jgi:hypothetical protein
VRIDYTQTAHCKFRLRTLVSLQHPSRHLISRRERWESSTWRAHVRVHRDQQVTEGAPHTAAQRRRTAPISVLEGRGGVEGPAVQPPRTLYAISKPQMPLARYLDRSRPAPCTQYRSRRWLSGMSESASCKLSYASASARWAHNQNLASASELDELLLLFRPQNALQWPQTS